MMTIWLISWLEGEILSWTVYIFQSKIYKITKHSQTELAHWKIISNICGDFAIKKSFHLIFLRKILDQSRMGGEGVSPVWDKDKHLAYFCPFWDVLGPFWAFQGLFFTSEKLTWVQKGQKIGVERVNHFGLVQKFSEGI